MVEIGNGFGDLLLREWPDITQCYANDAKGQ